MVAAGVWLMQPRWLRKWRAQRLARRITTPLGFVKLKPRDIELFDYHSEITAAAQSLPKNLQLIIRRLGPKDLSRLSLAELYGSTESTADVRRAVSVAAALYGFAIPHRCVLLDERTAAFLVAARRDLALTYVSPVRPAGLEDKTVIANSTTLTDLNIARYTSQLQIVASTLIHFAQQGAYPLFEAYVQTLNLNMKQSVRGTYSHDEIRSMASAYSILTFSRIPRSYAIVDARTYAIVSRVAQASTRPLRLVK
jgi:hypothetical protein